MSARKVSQNQYCVLIDNTKSITDDTILYYLLDNNKDIVAALEDIISTQNDFNIIKIIKKAVWDATNISGITDVASVINIIRESVSSIVQKADEYPMVTFILINNDKEIIFIDNKSNYMWKKDGQSKLEFNINSILKSVEQYINTMEGINEIRIENNSSKERKAPQDVPLVPQEQQEPKVSQEPKVHQEPKAQDVPKVPQVQQEPKVPQKPRRIVVV